MQPVRLLGSGGFGEVYLCRWHSADVAVSGGSGAGDLGFMSMGAITAGQLHQASSKGCVLVECNGMHSAHKWHTSSSTCCVVLCTGEVLEPQPADPRWSHGQH